MRGCSSVVGTSMRVSYKRSCREERVWKRYIKNDAVLYLCAAAQPPAGPGHDITRAVSSGLCREIHDEFIHL
jgi:hypothetical protein